MNDWALTLLLLTAFLNALGGVLAWSAKLWWSREHTAAKQAQIDNLKSQIEKLAEAKDETIRAKQAQIDALLVYVNELKDFTPMKVREYFLSVKEQLEEYIDVLEKDLQEAQNDIEDLQRQTEDEHAKAVASSEVIKQIEGEHKVLVAHESDLESQLKELEAQYSASQQALSLIETQQSLSSIKGLREYWDRKAEMSVLAMFPSDWHGSVDEFVAENDRLMALVMQLLIRLLDAKPNEVARDGCRHILEVGVGRGDLTILLLPETLKRGDRYSGIDVSERMREITFSRLAAIGIDGKDNANITDGLATRLTRKRDNPFEPNSIWLVIWGKLGEHLTRRSEWITALEEVKRVLEPGGYFLLYEPLQDLNEQYKAKPRKHRWTYIRSQKDYEDALLPMELLETATCNFGKEVYMIALWQKPKD